MKKLLFAPLLFILAPLIYAQQPLPNISYSGILNAACTNANTSCSGAVFVTGSNGGANAQGPIGSGSALDVPSSNYSAATITVSGTYAGATINFDFSDASGGGNYFQEVCARTDINLLEVSEVLPANQVRAWQCPVWATTRFRVRLSAYSSGSLSVSIALTPAAIDPSLVVAASIANVSGSSDPCQDVSAVKSSVAVNISSATTTQLVGISGTTTVYACQLTVTGAGTSPTLELEYGTGTTCGTGTTALTGVMLLSTSSVPLQLGGALTSVKAASGAALCLVSGGTSPSIQGVLTYVQQ